MCAPGPGGHPGANRALRSVRCSGCTTCIQRSCVQSGLGHEGLEAGALVSCRPLRRMQTPGIGQAGPRHVDDPAQLRVGLRLQAVGPGQPPVDLVLGWSQRRHDPQRAVYAQLVGAVITTPALRHSAQAGGEACAVRLYLHGVAAEGGAERPVARCEDAMPRKHDDSWFSVLSCSAFKKACKWACCTSCRGFLALAA